MASALTVLAAGADVNIPCEGFKSPAAHVSSGEGRVDILRAVIQRGEDLEVVDSEQYTALNLRVYPASPSILRFLGVTPPQVKTRSLEKATSRVPLIQPCGRYGCWRWYCAVQERSASSQRREVKRREPSRAGMLLEIIAIRSSLSDPRKGAVPPIDGFCQHGGNTGSWTRRVLSNTNLTQTD